MNHIELFAGCGGLSLGLEQNDFEITLANELSPMAAESFAYNLLGENLEKLAADSKIAKKVIWLNSNYPDLKFRLRENPFTFPTFDDEGFSDIPKNKKELKGKLVVGSIVELNRLLESDRELVELLRTNFEEGGRLDLVSGGPPCQSFSMAGLRQRDSDKNTLPWEFAKFVQHTQPKIALLENVTGILRAFKDDDGNAFHAWYEVAKVFASIQYVPLCLHINARFAGVAQNRPRFIMIAVRKDQFDAIYATFKSGSPNHQLFETPLYFYEKVQDIKDELPFGYLDYFDVTKPAHRTLLEGSFLADLINEPEVTVREAVDDLRSGLTKQSDFVKKLNSTFKRLPKRHGQKNHEYRNNSELVKRRFRLYQVLAEINDRTVTKEIFLILKSEADALSEYAWEACKKYDFLQQDGSLETFNSIDIFIRYLKAHPTKKQTQKALIANSPAPAALSIPDDGCHYHRNEIRVLTVREMARIQSFPDNFVFRSKVTTGGQMRKFEVPQYTQVGNAVPPLLGLKLGKCIKALLNCSK